MDDVAPRPARPTKWGNAPTCRRSHGSFSNNLSRQAYDIAQRIQDKDPDVVGATGCSGGADAIHPLLDGLPPIKNQLIEMLPRKARNRLLAVCEPVQLDLGQVLIEAGSMARHAYFPTDAFISLVTAVDGKPALEVGMVGAEGMLGAQLSLGVSRSPLHAVVQGAGGAGRLSTSEFRAELLQSAALQLCVKRYVYVLMVQLATSAGCLRFHNITQRLARWLLMTHDRTESDHFLITHAFLAYMLGVRREGITEGAGDLQKRGIIEYHRGQISVLDRTALEGAACECYETDRRAYADVLT